jgi:lambda repressor-like predicted transcriptional regulator
MLARILTAMTPLNVFLAGVRRLEREGVSLAEVGRRAGVHPSQMRLYRAGACAIGPKNAQKLAPVLGVDPAALLWDSSTKKRAS